MTAPEAARDVAAFQSRDEVRWCPGCGDFSILKQFQRVLAELPAPRENHVVVSGIGCSSRLPYYVETYGVHGIHGRAPALATGVKSARPELTVWVVTGDGDGLSIGLNHLLHTLRRNVDLKILLFNNHVYGLTKGQHSPTSPVGQASRTLGAGVEDRPLDVAALALAGGAGFFARAWDRDTEGLRNVLRRAAAHRGTALVEVFQNCPVFNDGAFDEAGFTALAAGEPVALDGGVLGFDALLTPQVVAPGSPRAYVHDETAQSLHLALAGLHAPEWPVPLGVLRAVERPVFGAAREVKRRRSVAELLG